MNNLDFKKISLLLFGQNIAIKLNPESETARLHGQELSGVLTGRSWGEKFDFETGKIEQTVIAISIRSSGKEIILLSTDVEEIKQA